MGDPIWLQIARKELGVHEIPGPKATARIVEYGKATTLKATSDEVPWCSSFVNWCVREARKVCPDLDLETRSAAAASWASWGYELEEGELGCITVLERPGGHHVGFYVDENDYGVHLLGGNQSDMVCIKTFPWELILNFRWPINYKGVD